MFELQIDLSEPVMDQLRAEAADARLAVIFLRDTLFKAPTRLLVNGADMFAEDPAILPTSPWAPIPLASAGMAMDGIRRELPVSGRYVWELGETGAEVIFQRMNDEVAIESLEEFTGTVPLQEIIEEAARVASLVRRLLSELRPDLANEPRFSW